MQIIFNKNNLMTYEEIAIHILERIDGYLSKKEQKKMLYNAFKQCRNEKVRELYIDIQIFNVVPSIHFRVLDLLFEKFTEDSIPLTYIEEELINEEGENEYVYRVYKDKLKTYKM